MTDGKKQRQRKKVPTLQELDDMPEDGTPNPAGSSKGRPTGAKRKRKPIRVRKGVGQNKKVAKATLPPPSPVPPQPSEYPTHDEYARAMALYEAENQGHQMGPFKEWPNDGGRDRAYESKCSICDRLAKALVQYLEGYPDAMGQPRWHGDATRSPCQGTEISG